MKRNESDLGVLVGDVLGDKIRQARQTQGMHQKDVAMRAKVSQRSVENAESSKRMRLTTISRIAHAVGLTLQDVVPGLSSTGDEGQPPAAFAPHLISFDWLLQEGGPGFIGREEVFQELDSFTGNPANRSGYFIVQGEPGTGKTALMAHLARERKYLHHFNVALQGINTPQQFLGNVISRVILRYGLSYSELPQEAFASGSCLNEVLTEAARRPQSFSEPIILLIDALDEVDSDGAQQGANVLYLPNILPPRVYVVITTLRIENIALRAANARVINLDSLASLSGDLHRFLKQQVKDKRAQQWLKQYGHTEAEFIDAMLQRSEGNFMYVHRIMSEICQGYYTDGKLDSLPYGLMAHYRGHWEEMCRRNLGSMDKAHESVLAVLATTNTASTSGEIAHQSGVDISVVRRVLTRWRPFLDEEVDPEEDHRRYRLYHSTFRKFVRDEIGGM